MHTGDSSNGRRDCPPSWGTWTESREEGSYGRKQGCLGTPSNPLSSDQPLQEAPHNLLHGLGEQMWQERGVGTDGLALSWPAMPLWLFQGTLFPEQQEASKPP